MLRHTQELIALLVEFKYIELGRKVKIKYYESHFSAVLEGLLVEPIYYLIIWRRIKSDA